MIKIKQSDSDLVNFLLSVSWQKGWKLPQLYLKYDSKDTHLNLITSR